MPSERTIPSRTERLCEPCPHHKMMNAFYGHNSSWRDFNCMHPDAFKELTSDLTPAQKAVLSKLDALRATEGRHIGRTDKQPDWCPLKPRPETT